jgi:cation diffusion facilitator CzcD-associated flavoprotein CzcO
MLEYGYRLTWRYSDWKYPNIEGITDFKGKLLHSARWDDSYDFEDKKVAVIGIGSSGIQIVPKLAPRKVLFRVMNVLEN